MLGKHKGDHSERTGFSLLELVAVVTLVGIVSAVIMMRLNGTDNKTARENVVEDNLRILQTAVERYRFDKGVFPDDFPDLIAAGYIDTSPRSLDTGKAFSIDKAKGKVEYK